MTPGPPPTNKAPSSVNRGARWEERWGLRDFDVLRYPCLLAGEVAQRPSHMYMLCMCMHMPMHMCMSHSSFSVSMCGERETGRAFFKTSSFGLGKEI